jgi:peptidoglycan-associated lipoprotein
MNTLQRAACLLTTAALLAGCASLTGRDPSLPDAVVERTSDRTTWATAQALAAAEAEAAAKAARAAAPQTRVVAVEAAPAAAAAPAATAVDAEAPVQRVLYFDFDRYEVKDEFKPMIERRARALVADRSQHIVVEGHADERGSREYNLALGQKRAEAVVRALALLGVLEAQLEAVSFGDTRPAVEGSNEIAWSQNRRAELKDR